MPSRRERVLLGLRSIGSAVRSRFSVLGFVALHVSGHEGANGWKCSTVDHECLKLVRKVFILELHIMILMMIKGAGCGGGSREREQ